MSKDINCNDAETIKHENSNDILDYIKELGELATGDETLSKYSGILVKFLTEQKVKCFDFRSSSDLKYIGKGSFSTVSSVIFEGRIYALKSLNNNIQMNKTQLKQFTRELMNLYEANHANIIKLHGISRAEPNDRPSLNEISRKLENLSTESIEFITNKITHNQIETEQHDSKSLDQEHNRANNSSINNNSFTDVVDNETIGK
ncbi:1635_t:CDS:2 [Gigaspora rosea]|nr:1635_t:CDS:2 [Gigaspora rosea]